MFWNYPKRRYKRSFAATKRRRYRYKKRKYARKTAINRGHELHAYKRYGTTRAYNWSNPTTSLDQAFSFYLSDVTNYTDFTNLYDQYRINMVVMKVRMVNVPEAYAQAGSTVTPNSMNMYPRIWWTLDYDDTTAENWTTLKQRGTAKFKHMNPRKDTKIVIRPRPLIQLYNSAIDAGYATHKKCWINCANSDVPHYGLKWSIEAAGFTPVNLAPYSFSVDTIYYLQLRNSR